MTRRQAILLLLVLGASSVWIIDPLKPSAVAVVQAISRPENTLPPVAASRGPALPTSPTWPLRSSLARPPVDVFSPPAPPPAPAPPPPPPAPVLPPIPPALLAPQVPFSVVAVWTEDGKTEVFLGGESGTFLAHEGDTLPGQYRVDHIGKSDLQLTYMPMNLVQHLDWNAQ